MGDDQECRSCAGSTSPAAPRCSFSREDLSTGIVGEPVGGILGYTPKSATALVQRLLALVAPPKPEVKPEPKPEEKPAGT